MAEKILNTRIQLKYDTYTNWKNANTLLKQGEVAIATLAEDLAQEVNSTSKQPILMKVGPGNFNDLPWVSALAADVYSWAKQETLPFVRNDGSDKAEGNVISSIKFENNQVVYTTASVATSEGMAGLQEAVDAIEEDIANNRDAWAKDDNTIYTFAKSADGKGITITPSEGDANTITFAFLTQAEIEALNYLVAADITTGSANGTIAVEGTDVAVKGLQDAAYVTVASLNETAEQYAKAAKEAAEKYADDNDDNTAHTHSVGAGLSMSGAGGITGNVEYSANIDVKYEGSNIYLIDKTSGETIGEGFDASVFVKDSYLESAVYDPDTNILTFTFIDNKDNLEAIPVNLTDLVDVYTADEASLTKTGSTFSIKNSGVTTEKIADDAVTADKLANTINEDIAKGVAAKTIAEGAFNAFEVSGNELVFSKTTGSPAVIGFSTDNYIFMEALGNATGGYIDAKLNFKRLAADLEPENAKDAEKLGGQAPEYYATAESVTDITKDNGTIDTKVKAAIDAEIERANSAYATATQGGKADTALQSVQSAEGNGIKATTSGTAVTIDWDPDIVFVFDCGNATVI